MPQPQSQEMDEQGRQSPTYRGLFRFVRSADLIVLLPAVATSVGSGIQTPAFSILMGKIFTAFGDYSRNTITEAELERQVSAYVIGICIVGIFAWGLGWAH